MIKKLKIGDIVEVSGQTCMITETTTHGQTGDCTIKCQAKGEIIVPEQQQRLNVFEPFKINKMDFIFNITYCDVVFEPGELVELSIRAATQDYI